MGIPGLDARWPRLSVLANGAPLAGVQAAEIVSSNHFAADHFSVTAAVSADPLGIKALVGQSEVLVEIAVSLGDGAGYVPLVSGEVDQVDLDPIQGVLRLEGRDLSARLIEARTQESFSNRTASEIATLLAGRHGLTPDVTLTTAPVGRYWQLQHDRIVLDQFGRATTEWDLLVMLAQYEGVDLWVSGTTLHFRKNDASGAAWRLSAGDVTGLRLERSLTLARDIEVVVKSWNSRSGTAFVQTARKKAFPVPRGRVQRYVLVVPNLSPDEALKLAQARLAELTRHERVVIAEMPGELDILPRQRILLLGTETDFDQEYRVDRVERHLSVSHGFMQTLHMRNVDDASQVTVPAEEAGA